MAEKNSKKRDKIIIQGARVNNLKNIDAEIPRESLVVITGLSGSGKSSLAFDVIYAEGNRRYLEGMSSYARQFLEVGAEPNVDKIENLSPTISIDQKSLSRSPRSTVGTLTEIYDYLRILFAKIGSPHCPKCGKVMARKNFQEIASELFAMTENTQVAILAKTKEVHKTSREVLRSISQMGYARVRFNGKIMLTSEALLVASDELKVPIEVVVDRIIVKHKNPDEERILDSIETALKIGNGSLIVCVDNDEEKTYNKDFVCDTCEVRISEITPKHFSFNNPEGACAHCSGLGITREVDVDAVMPYKNLSIAEGAILPWSKSNGRTGGQPHYLGILQALGREYGFSIYEPVKKLSRRALEIILYGPDKKEVIVEQKNDIGGVREIKVSFEGLVPMIQKKWSEATSEYVRNELEKYMRDTVCHVCEGKRLKAPYLSVMIGEYSVDDVVTMDLNTFKGFLEKVRTRSDGTRQGELVAQLVKKMKGKADSLTQVGLEYLSLARGANSISGGEGQRIRLATQIDSELMGIMYILDEPSIGLHNRDTEKLIKTMQRLRESGNSVVVVEHDEDIIRHADWVIDMGPGAGTEGGRIIFQGNVPRLLKSKTSTAQYLQGNKKVAEKKIYRKGNKKYIEIVGAREHNLKNITLAVPLGKFVSVTGVSGSGKSTLVRDILAKAVSRHFFHTREMPGAHKKIKGLNYIDKVIHIDQSPIGRTPRSNAATYTGVFSLVREIFADTPEAVKKGYTPSRFSFNMKGGRCEACQGNGTKKIEMHLLPDVYIECEVCSGTRYNKRTLSIEYQGMTIADVLSKSVSEAILFFRRFPLIMEKLNTLEEVGLGYLKLGQSATNLSGGEAQRIKLASELARKSTGKTLYILDEPTIGLHFEDIRKLLSVLDMLVDKGNTVLVVEHNLHVIRNSDWVIDLGPEGGDKGGEVVFQGTPDKLRKVKKSWTGKYL